MPHLAGSLLTIFLFLLAQVLLKPYLNQGLNIFQRLSLISVIHTHTHTNTHKHTHAYIYIHRYIWYLPCVRARTSAPRMSVHEHMRMCALTHACITIRSNGSRCSQESASCWSTSSIFRMGRMSLMAPDPSLASSLSCQFSLIPLVRWCNPSAKCFQT
jgi:hypothetical protein